MLYFENCATVQDVIDLKRSEAPDHADILKLPEDSSFLDLVSYMADFRVGAIFVCDGDGKVSGIVSERDIVRHLALNGENVFSEPIERIVTRNIIACHAPDALKKVAADMAEKHIRHIAVKDGEDNIVGLVSASDIELFAGTG